MAQAVEHHNTMAIKQFIGHKITSKFGAPKQIMTNCGRELLSKDMKLYYEGKNIDHLPTTPYHTQGSRRVERLNGALLEILHKLCTTNVSTWPQKLPTALMVVQSWVNWDLNSHPSKWLWVSTQNHQNIKGLKLIKPKKVPQRDQMTQHHQDIQSKATEQAAKRIQEQVNQAVNHYKVGDKVWVLNLDTSKLQPGKIGPYVVNRKQLFKKVKGKIYPTLSPLNVSIWLLRLAFF